MSDEKRIGARGSDVVESWCEGKLRRRKTVLLEKEMLEGVILGDWRWRSLYYRGWCRRKWFLKEVCLV